MRPEKCRLHQWYQYGSFQQTRKSDGHRVSEDQRRVNDIVAPNRKRLNCHTVSVKPCLLTFI